MVVYYSGTGIVPKVKIRYRKASFSKIAMHIDATYAFAWMSQYVASVYVFMIMMCFEGHLRHISEIMWSILRMQKLQKHGCRLSLSNWLFKNRPDGPGKDQSCVAHILEYHPLFSFIDN